MIDLDQLDKKLLHILQTNDVFTPNIREIAQMLGVAPSTIHFRISRLTKDGVITAPHLTVRGVTVGRSLTMICLVKVKPGQGSEKKTFHELVPRQLSALSQIQEIHVLQGGWDILVKLLVRDTREYNDILRNSILTLGGIQEVVGLTSLETVKDSDTVLLE
jgi:Lrp/AsnC family transcriptional regulator, leucine-responsive regulatory protein